MTHFKDSMLKLVVETSTSLSLEQWESDDIEVRLILKGGGCENKAAAKELTKFAEPSSTIELLNSPQVTLKE